MLRIGRQLRHRCRTLSRGNFSPINQHTKSVSTSNTSGSGRSVLIGSGVLLASGALTVGLAWQVPNFRRSVEETVPFSNYIFDPILGSRNETKISSKTPQKPLEDRFETPMRSVIKKDESTEEIPTSGLDILPTDLDKLEEENTIKGEKLDQNEKTLPDQVTISDQDHQLESTAGGEVKGVEMNAAENEELGSHQDHIPEIVVASVEEDALEQDEPQRRSPEAVEDRLLELEEDVLADHAAISTILDEVLASCAKQCLEAIESNTEAAKAVELHTSLLRDAMSDSHGSETRTAEGEQKHLTDVSQVSEQKSRLQSEAESTYREARKSLTKLKSVIDQAKQMSNPDLSQKIIQAEENHSEMLKEVEEAVGNMNVKLSESHVMSQYKDLVDKAKKQFREELLAVMPDVKVESGWRSLSQKMTTDDLNALIAHAHRRVDQLQRELAEERALSSRRMEMAVQAARELWEEQKEEEVAKKIDQLQQLYNLEHDKKMEEARQSFEGEMRIQLKRQAAAHSDHLSDMLNIQEKQIKAELQEEFKMKFQERESRFNEEMEALKTNFANDIHDLTEKFQFDLNKALSKVAGIESVIDGRAYIESESRKAQELWLACEGLRIALQYGDRGRPIPLKAELQAISQVQGVDSSMLELIKAFPKDASEKGVFTEESLKVSYKKVSRICRRLSMVSETRNSLFTYFISYMKSFLIISRAQNEPPADLKAEDLDTFKILSYATYCLEHGDLEQATRFMNQLGGEPRRMAEGWLREARLLLETRQVAEALLSLASAISMATNLEL